MSDLWVLEGKDFDFNVFCNFNIWDHNRDTSTNTITTAYFFIGLHNFIRKCIAILILQLKEA